ncbi:MAG: hypothetical protein HY799_04135 [Nitrosomonadales bacterium]|nr:hypothetical protein [Nitrosomonadales bacterium]
MSPKVVAVIPAHAGIQMIEESPHSGTTSLFHPRCGVLLLLDSRLVELLAIRLSWQTTPAKSLVMRGNDER